MTRKAAVIDSIPNRVRQNLAQEAYEAYARSTGWKSLVSGDPLPHWEALSEEIQSAWRSSAAWVAGKCKGMHDWQQKKPAAILAVEKQIAISTCIGNAAIIIAEIDEAMTLELPSEFWFNRIERIKDLVRTMAEEVKAMKDTER